MCIELGYPEAGGAIELLPLFGSLSMKCRAESCDKDGDYYGWCSWHYDEYRARDKGPCSVKDCVRNAQTRGMCQVHYVTWYRRNRPMKVMDTKLKGTYGITIQQYNELHAAQKGVCAICERPEFRQRDGKVFPLIVDHDERTGA